MIAVSLNIGAGIRLIKLAKLFLCTLTHLTNTTKTHGAGYAKPWFHTAEPLGERRYKNWITHTQNSVDQDQTVPEGALSYC